MSSLPAEQEPYVPVYIVVGRSGGIGLEVCRKLRKKQAKVVAASRSQEKLSSLSAETGVDPVVIDATSPEQVKQCFDHIAERYGRIDGVVHCVGSFLLKPAHLTRDGEWDATIINNLHPPFMCFAQLHEL